MKHRDIKQNDKKPKHDKSKIAKKTSIKPRSESSSCTWRSSRT